MESIDLTPTWEGIVIQLAEVYSNADTLKSRRFAEDELLRMARLADSYVKLRKDSVNFDAKENSVKVKIDVDS